MSFAGVRNGLVTTIQAHGKWAASQISACDFGIIELSGSAVVLAPGPGTRVTPRTFGKGFGAAAASSRDKEVTYDMSGFVFVKDPGNPTAWLGSLWTACDDIFNSVNRDDTLNGAALAAHVETISRPDPDTYYTLNDVDYAVIRFTVRATELVDGP